MPHKGGLSGRGALFGNDLLHVVEVRIRITKMGFIFAMRFWVGQKLSAKFAGEKRFRTIFLGIFFYF